MPKVTKAGLRPTLFTSNMVVRIDVKEGETILATKEFEWENIPTNIQSQLSLHGLNTLLQQRTSDVKGNPEGKLEAMEDVYERLCEGEWSAERKSGTRTVPAIIEVLAGLKGCDIGAAQKAFAKLNDEQKAQLRAKYFKEVEEVEAKRATASVSLDDLL